ncbi:palmitoyltransferase ZDHHC6 [Drosophila subpulchrella]|uniref:palmitoyltransferase ZDHHC6 n=1 Tax=Drosophila subpulchrella TaxID=1486046 RepID=UPI0018A19591|nr:palmitoyltransferase ZDHHC6 [Drosophila subpulchrella]
MSCDLKDDLRRFLHWGPITLLSLTLIVTWTVIDMNSMWWNPVKSPGSLINYGLIWFHTFGTLYYFIKSLMVGPGFLPLRWYPNTVTDTEFLQFCHRCNGYKAPRTHHCRRCDRCVMKMDHHCPWINNCVGWSNQASFVYFLLFFLSGSIQGSIIIICGVIQGIQKRWYIRQGLHHLATVHLTPTNLMACVFSMGVMTGTGLASIKLLYMQMKVILKNQTEIESWIVKKAVFRRNAYPANRIKAFVFPYNLGWSANWREVFLSSGDGISWPVLPGCDQYTLTREQLEQKKDKRARTRLYKCIRPATGHWVPIFSQGLWVSLKIPCTDDPRIALQPGDLIHVTRIQDYWLYGERGISEEEKVRGRKGGIRGWFPSCCAMEVFDEDPENEEMLPYNIAGGEPYNETDKTDEENMKNTKVPRDFPSQDGKPQKRIRTN